jgi:hypothetical protein
VCLTWWSPSIGAVTCDHNGVGESASRSTRRITIHTLGRRLGITDDAAATHAIRQLLGVDDT